MREKLFKAKRIDNGQWIEGYLIYDKSDDLYSILVDFEYSTGTCITSGNAPKVWSSSICEYTGLTDKYGQKIWENDIVEIPAADEYYLIQWNDTEARWEMYNEINSLVVDFDNYWSYEVVVVGNVFNNPSLVRPTK